MRHLIVKNFALYCEPQMRIFRIIAIALFIPSFLITGFLTDLSDESNSTVAIVLAAISVLFYFAPVGSVINWNRLRASRIIYPVFLATAIVVTKLQENFADTLFIILALIPLFVCIWLGFGGYKIGYFDLFPVKREELDEQQKKQWDEFHNLLG